MGSIQTRIPNRLDAMAEVTAMVEAFGNEHGLSRRILNDVNVALDEVLNNVISYAFEPGARTATFDTRPGQLSACLSSSICNRHSRQVELHPVTNWGERHYTGAKLRSAMH